MTARDVTPCPLCGAASLLPNDRTAPLLAVADYLVARALSGVDDLITRGRAFGGGRAATTQLRRDGVQGSARLVLGAPAAAVDKAISGRTDGWRVIALMLDDRASATISARQVQAVLTDYVHDLVDDRQPHTTAALRQKLHHDLGLALHADVLETASA